MASKPKLGEYDLTYIEEGFKTGAEKVELEKAEAVLKKLGYEKVGSNSQVQEKEDEPGNGPNQTEDNILIRIEFLGLLLGTNAKKRSIMNTLPVVVKLLMLYKELCMSGLYLTQAERAEIKFLIGNVQDVRDVVAQASELLRPAKMHCVPEKYVPTAADMKNWLSDLSKAVARSWSDSWAQIVDDAITTTLSRLDENQLYSAIQIHLGLAFEGRSTDSCEEEIKMLKSEASDDPGAIEEKASRLRSLEFEMMMGHLYGRKISRNKTLWAAIAQLLNMRSVIDSCRLVRVDGEIERLHAFLRRISYGSDPRPLPSAFDKLTTIFLQAIQRQGHSPFFPLFNEERDPGPAWIPEDGQLKAFPPSWAHIDPAEFVISIVMEAGSAGLLKSEIVKKLLAPHSFSQATAYKAITSAEKQKKIQKLEGKRYVIGSGKMTDESEEAPSSELSPRSTKSRNARASLNKGKPRKKRRSKPKKKPAQ